MVDGVVVIEIERMDDVEWIWLQIGGLGEIPEKIDLLFPIGNAGMLGVKGQMKDSVSLMISGENLSETLVMHLA